MRKPPESHHISKRYLTPFYCFALGLMVVLVLSACGQKQAMPSSVITPTSSSLLTATQLPHYGTQAHDKNTITPLPGIPNTPDVRTPSPLGVKASQLQGLEVTVWYPWSGATEDSFWAVLDEFNRTNQWGITVKPSRYEGFGSLDEAVEAGLSAAQLPDVILDYGYQARHWDRSGVLVDLAPYANDSVWGLSKNQQEDFYRPFWDEDLVSGSLQPEARRLGIPFFRSAYALFYNKSWAEELGFPNPPTTPEDFRMQACAAAESVAISTDKLSLGKGGWLINSDPSLLAGWIYAFGAGITNPSGEGYLFSTPELNQALDYLKGLQESGCAWFDSGQDPQAALANRQAMFIAGSLYDIPSQQAAFSQSGSGDVWLVIPFPSSTAPVTVTYGPSLTLTRSTPAGQLASWLVIEWLVYPPNQAKVVQQLGVYPTRQSTLSYFIHTDEAHTQWAQALTLLPQARSEPSLVSWNILRWALSDVAVQLFSPQFGEDQVPDLISNLDNLAEEIINQER